MRQERKEVLARYLDEADFSTEERARLEHPRIWNRLFEFLDDEVDTLHAEEFARQASAI